MKKNRQTTARCECTDLYIPSECSDTRRARGVVRMRVVLRTTRHPPIARADHARGCLCSGRPLAAANTYTDIHTYNVRKCTSQSRRGIVHRGSLLVYRTYVRRVDTDAQRRFLPLPVAATETQSGVLVISCVRACALASKHQAHRLFVPTALGARLLRARHWALRLTLGRYVHTHTTPLWMLVSATHVYCTRSSLSLTHGLAPARVSHQGMSLRQKRRRSPRQHSRSRA